MSKDKYEHLKDAPKREKPKSSGSQSLSHSSKSATVLSQQTKAVPKTKLAAESFEPLQPEQMSLDAYNHIQKCLSGKKAEYLQKEDVTAVVQLAQHLRVFGLLSAVGYIRHARDGKIRERIRPMWTPLLWCLVCDGKQRPEDEKDARQTLMRETYRLSTDKQKEYMVTWRRALKLSNHWNFWARACQEEEADKSDEQSTENGNTAG